MYRESASQALEVPEDFIQYNIVLSSELMTGVDDHQGDDDDEEEVGGLGEDFLIFFLILELLGLCSALSITI